jgi:hypothetical protein
MVHLNKHESASEFRISMQLDGKPSNEYYITVQTMQFSDIAPLNLSKMYIARSPKKIYVGQLWTLRPTASQDNRKLWNFFAYFKESLNQLVGIWVSSSEDDYGQLIAKVGGLANKRVDFNFLDDAWALCIFFFIKLN